MKTLLPNILSTKHRILLNVHASVAGTFRIERTTTNNVANFAYAQDLVVGDNVVVFEFVAHEAELMLTAVIGQYGPATLTFDNFQLYIYE